MLPCLRPRAAAAALATSIRACRRASEGVLAPAPKRERAMDAAARKAKLIKGATGDWEVVIGMEVHAQVTSRAKLFSGASTEFGGEANAHVSLVDAAMPGMLPVLNEECVRQAVRTGLGLHARINLKSVFDRKNYFYPDLPQGYQISQYKSPIVGEGEVVVDLADGEAVRVGIERLHLEQDAGKSIHDQNPALSLVDLNRSGVALMEIVSKPDLRSAEEAKAFLAKMRSILRYLGTCDGDMEKGSLAPTSTSRCASPARRSARAAKSRTSTRSASSARPSSTRRAAKSRSSRTAARSGRRPGCSIRTRARRDRCAPRKRRTTTAISRSGSAAARTVAFACRRAAKEPAGAAGREKVALRARLCPLRLRRRRADRQPANGSFLSDCRGK